MKNLIQSRIQKTFLISFSSILMASQAFAYGNTEYFSKDEKACACKVTTHENIFKSTVTITNTTVERHWPDEDETNVFYDRTYPNTNAMGEESTHPTYEQAYQSCRLAIKGYIGAGLCSPGSAIPESTSLALNEVGERTRFFNLSAQEQAILTYSLAMARYESDNELYAEIAHIYQEQAYADRELLIELLKKVGSHKNKTIIKYRRH